MGKSYITRRGWGGGIRVEQDKRREEGRPRKRGGRGGERGEWDGECGEWLR